jgi:predicted thioesterase
MKKAYFQAGRKVKAKPLYQFENGWAGFPRCNRFSKSCRIREKEPKMRQGLEPGLEHELERVVTPRESVLQERTAPVFSTAEMIKLMEFTAYKLLEPYYEDHESSVGVHVEVRHLAATPVGMRVRALARLTRIEGRRCFFDVSAYDEREPIGKGAHERVIIDVNRFREKLEAKL